MQTYPEYDNQLSEAYDLVDAELRRAEQCWPGWMAGCVCVCWRLRCKNTFCTSCTSRINTIVRGHIMMLLQLRLMRWRMLRIFFAKLGNQGESSHPNHTTELSSNSMEGENYDKRETSRTMWPHAGAYRSGSAALSQQGDTMKAATWNLKLCILSRELGVTLYAAGDRESDLCCSVVDRVDIDHIEASSTIRQMRQQQHDIAAKAAIEAMRLRRGLRREDLPASYGRL